MQSPFVPAFQFSADGGGVALGVIFLVIVVVIVRMLSSRSTSRIVTKLGTIEVGAKNAEVHAATAREAAVVAASVVDDVKNAIGSPNGNGSTTQMLERIGDRLDRIEDGQAALNHRVTDGEQRATRRHEAGQAAIAALGGRLSDVATRVDELAAR